MTPTPNPNLPSFNPDDPSGPSGFEEFRSVHVHRWTREQFLAFVQHEAMFCDDGTMTEVFHEEGHGVDWPTIEFAATRTAQSFNGLPSVQHVRIVCHHPVEPGESPTEKYHREHIAQGIQFTMRCAICYAPDPEEPDTSEHDRRADGEEE